MKNKYKLIKEYPGSPKLGAIVELKRHGGYELENSTSYFMTKDKVENYPEFWEEIVEKDYEILEYKTESGISCKAPFLQDSYQFYMDERCTINSVKRLSDGEVFTVGDKIQLDEDNTTYGTITELYISHEQLRFYCGKLGGVLCHDIDKRNNFKKVKQPLFTTEDGVDIYEGDEYYFVNSNWYIGKGTDYILGITSKYFSTKEAAEEYILRNKPCLSLNDVAEIYKTANISMSEYTSKKDKNQNHDQGVKLIDLIKEKLKL